MSNKYYNPICQRLSDEGESKRWHMWPGNFTSFPILMFRLSVYPGANLKRYATEAKWNTFVLGMKLSATPTFLPFAHQSSAKVFSCSSLLDSIPTANGNGVTTSWGPDDGRFQSHLTHILQTCKECWNGRILFSWELGWWFCSVAVLTVLRLRLCVAFVLRFILSAKYFHHVAICSFLPPLISRTGERLHLQ